MLVTDASVLTLALAGSPRQATAVATRLRGQALVAPAILPAEVASALRGRVLGGKLTEHHARAALVHLTRLPVRLTSSPQLLSRAWELKDNNLTTYDALYVALAELTGATLLTGDVGLTQAPGIRCRTEIMAG